MSSESISVPTPQPQGDSLVGVNHRVIQTNGITMHIAEMGEGPLVVLLHGFPESWYSWRHQLPALAEAGYHAVAPDQRGYGQTDRPAVSEKYTQLHLVGDVIGLLDALGEQRAVVVGHDWGAPVAWNTALMRPDRVRGVGGLSVPYAPRGPVSMLTAMRAALGDGFYMQYFQAPGIADAELARDVRTTMRRILYGASGDAPRGSETAQPVAPEGQGFLDLMPDPETLPDWLTEADLDVFVAEFERTGFTGGLNWYRAIDLSWELMAPWHGAVVAPPALYGAGDRDGRQSPRHGPVPAPFEGVCAEPDADRHPAGSRALDAARATGRGQHGATGVPCRALDRNGPDPTIR